MTTEKEIEQKLINKLQDLKYTYREDICNRFTLLPEQQKIADCLTSLDELISAEGEKLVALKDHKKGLMQKLFP